MSIISRETSKKSTKTPVSHCGFCGKLVVADDTLYVSLSRRSPVGFGQYRQDEVGFCVPCCRDCLSFWRKKYVKNVIFGVLFFLIVLFVLLLCPPVISIVCGIVCGIVFWSLWLVRVKTLFPVGLLETLNLPWISKLIEDGYSIKVIYPRYAQSGDMQEENGEKVYYLGHGHRERRYYTWKGCVNFHSKRMLGERSATWLREVFLALRCAFHLFVFMSGLLTIWIGCLVLIAYLYFGNGHQGETSFSPIVISLALAIALTYGFCRLMSWIRKRKSA